VTGRSNSIDVILFDFGGVVAPMSTPETALRLEAELGLEESTLHALMYGGELWEAVSDGSITEDDYWRELALAVQHEPPRVREALRPLWEPELIDEEVVALVRSLRESYRVALLSNATHSLEGQIQRFGLEGFFDPVMNSSRIRLRKPDAEAFHYALRTLAVAPERVHFIDDRERNTSVAAELGMQVIVFEDAAQLRQRLVQMQIL